jgi:high-affinity Fe2+/Pb2+ permease
LTGIFDDRTAIAGERSSEEVRRLRFQRMTYGQLAGAAVTALVIPFIGSARQDVFSGWSGLWLVLARALLLLVAVQAFRKWRFEQEDSYRNVISGSSDCDDAKPADDPSSRTKAQLRR